MKAPPPHHRGGRPPEERRRRSKLAKWIAERGLIRGTLSERYQRCGKANCHCAQGQKHRVLMLVVTKNRRTYQLYVPPAWEETVRQWVENRQEIERLMEELSDLHWEKVRKRQG